MIRAAAWLMLAGVCSAQDLLPDLPPAEAPPPPPAASQPAQQTPPPQAQPMPAAPAARPPNPSQQQQPVAGVAPVRAPAVSGVVDSLRALAANPPSPALDGMMRQHVGSAPFPILETDAFGLVGSGGLAVEPLKPILPPEATPEELFAAAVQSISTSVRLSAPSEKWILAGDREIYVGDRITISVGDKLVPVDFVGLRVEEAVFRSPETGQSKIVRIMPKELSLDGGDVKEDPVEKLPGMQLERR